MEERKIILFTLPRVKHKIIHFFRLGGTNYNKIKGVNGTKMYTDYPQCKTDTRWTDDIVATEFVG